MTKRKQYTRKPFPRLNDGFYYQVATTLVIEIFRHIDSRLDQISMTIQRTIDL
jgi:hypothetical protein